MPTDRPNRTLSTDVELALFLVDRVGLRAAAQFLEARGAGFALICRVLAEPARRRAAELPAPATVPATVPAR
jgi:hypothetical protein